jgi:hypothetical protein
MNLQKRGGYIMKTRLCRLEFAITGMADLRFLYRAWDNLWAIEDRGNAESIMIYVTVDDRLPGEEVSLNFTATPEVLDKFLGILEQGGLKFSRHDFLPGFLITCRVDHDRGSLHIIDGKGGHDSGGGQEG